MTDKASPDEVPRELSPLTVSIRLEAVAPVHPPTGDPTPATTIPAPSRP